MTMLSRLTPAFGIVPLVALSGCAGEPRQETATVEHAARVEILAPADGDTVSQPFTVRLAAHGAELVAASGVREEGRGHHHLVIDLDLPSPDVPILTGLGLVHIGTGAAERMIDSLPPGPHRIIAVLGYGDHVPVTGMATDTIRIVVR